MPKYSLGLDYGTLSGRALLIDAVTGDEVSTSVFDYPRGVMDEALPDGHEARYRFRTAASTGLHRRVSDDDTGCAEASACGRRRRRGSGRRLHSVHGAAREGGRNASVHAG